MKKKIKKVIVSILVLFSIIIALIFYWSFRPYESGSFQDYCKHHNQGNECITNLKTLCEKTNGKNEYNCGSNCHGGECTTTCYIEDYCSCNNTLWNYKRGCFPNINKFTNYINKYF